MAPGGWDLVTLSPMTDTMIEAVENSVESTSTMEVPEIRTAAESLRARLFPIDDAQTSGQRGL